MRTFQDRDFMVWEAYASAGMQAGSDRAHIIFNCLTQPELRSRFAPIGDTATAERALVDAPPERLLQMLENAREVA
jgi:hypothetical protein